MKIKKITIGDIRKDFGNHSFEGENPRMKLSTWLKRKGYKSLAEILEM